MISLAAPWALVGLLALPVVLWLHRRRRRPAPVDVPSLLFLEEEDASAMAPERVRLDAELLLALAGALLLAFAAAAPSRTPQPGRTVRVVVSTTPSMEAIATDGRTAAARAQAVVERIRQSLSSGDRLEVERATGQPHDLVVEARRGPASLRIVVSDRSPADPPADVRFVGVGDPDAENAGIVAVDVGEEGGASRLFVNVRNDGRAGTERRLTVSRGSLDSPTESATLALSAGEIRPATFALPRPLPDGVMVILEGTDALAQDNVALLRRFPLRVGFAPPPKGYADGYRVAIERALDAVAPGWQRDEMVMADLWVGPPETAPEGTGLALVLHPVPTGSPGVRPPPGAKFEPVDPVFGRDLDVGGVDLVYAPTVEARPPFPILRVRPSVWDTTRGPSPVVLEWFPDPLAGTPAPVDHPIWPLFLENCAEGRLGRPGPMGYRLLIADRDATVLGRDVAPFDPAWIEAAPLDRQARPRSLRPALAIGGGVCLLLLWLAPTLRRRWAA